MKFIKRIVKSDQIRALPALLIMIIVAFSFIFFMYEDQKELIIEKSVLESEFGDSYIIEERKVINAGENNETKRFIISLLNEKNSIDSGYMIIMDKENKIIDKRELSFDNLLPFMTN